TCCSRRWTRDEADAGDRRPDRYGAGAARARRGATPRGVALVGGAHARARGADRPHGPGRPARAPVRPRRGRALRRPRRARGPDRRPLPPPRPGDRPPLPRPRAAHADRRLRGLLPLLLPPRAGRPGRRVALRRAARTRVRVSRSALGDLGGDPVGRRSAGALAAPARRDRAAPPPPHARPPDPPPLS